MYGIDCLYEFQIAPKGCLKWCSLVNNSDDSADDNQLSFQQWFLVNTSKLLNDLCALLCAKVAKFNNINANFVYAWRGDSHVSEEHYVAILDDMEFNYGCIHFMISIGGFVLKIYDGESHLNLIDFQDFLDCFIYTLLADKV